MSVAIRIHGLDKLNSRLNKLTGAELDKRVRAGAFAVGKELEGILKPYPPKPPTSTYRRTKTLGRRWSTAPRRWGALVGNPTDYAHWVQSEAYQVWFHKRTGWKTDERAVNELSDDAVERIMLEAIMAGI